MSEANRAMPANAPQQRTCITCAYIQVTQRGQGNRHSYTSYCTKYGTNAHEERTSLGTCGPTGTAWQAMGTPTAQEYVLNQPQAPVVAGTPEETTIQAQPTPPAS